MVFGEVRGRPPDNPRRPTTRDKRPNTEVLRAIGLNLRSVTRLTKLTKKGREKKKEEKEKRELGEEA